MVALTDVDVLVWLLVLVARAANGYVPSESNAVL
jgi:hypothetical protein